MRAPDRRRWWTAAVIAGLGGLASLAIWSVFLSRQSLSAADGWSSVGSGLVAFGSAAVVLVVWLVRQGFERDKRDLSSALPTLRRGVQMLWGRAEIGRQLFLPRPLRLRWRPTRHTTVRAAAPPTSGGALRTEPAADQPAAVELVTAFRDPRLRQLVVLGEPGAGKSTLALLYVAAAIELSEPHEPVPVPMPIAAWHPSTPGDDTTGPEAGSDIEQWITERIAQDYPQLTAAQAGELVAERQIIAVLDGLDELPPARRGPALAQLERAAATGLRMLVTCRTAEYAEAVAETGVLPQAVVVDVESVTAADAITYLTEREAAGSTRWNPVIAVITGDPTGPLGTVLSTPLMISLARQVYQQPTTDPGELVTLPTGHDVQQRLLSRFLPSVYGPAGAAKADRWLTYLVGHLPTHPRDPDLRWWLLARAVPSLVIVALVSILMTALGAATGALCWATARGGNGGLLSAVLAGAIIGLPMGLAAGLHTARATRPAATVARRFRWLRTGMAVALDLYTAAGALSALSAVALAVTYAISAPRASTISISIVDILRQPAQDRFSFLLTLVIVFATVTVLTITNGLGTGWSGLPHRSTPRLRRLPPSLLSGLGVGLLLGAPWALAGSLQDTDVFNGLSQQTGLLIGLSTAGLVGIPLGLGRWLRSPLPARDGASPQSVLAQDRKAALLTASAIAGTAAVIAMTVMWVVDGRPRIIAATTLGVSVTAVALILLGSGSAWVAYCLARSWLAALGRLPWRLTRFLREAQVRGVLRQAGAAYQIRHDLIREHLLPTAAGPDEATAPSEDPGHRPAIGLRRFLPLAATAAALLLLPAGALLLDPRLAPRARLTSSSAGSRLLFSPDGRQVATMSPDSPVRVWESRSGRLISVIDTTVSKYGTSVQFSPDGRTLAINNVLKDSAGLWNAATGRLIADLNRYGRLDYPPPDGEINDSSDIWLPAGRWTTFHGPLHAVGDSYSRYLRHGMVFSPDSRLLATVELDGMLRLWDSSTGEPRGSVKTSSLHDTENGLLFSSDSGTLAAVDLDLSLHSWHVSATTDGQYQLAIQSSEESLVGFGVHAAVLIEQDGTLWLRTGAGRGQNVSIGRIESYQEFRPPPVTFNPAGNLVVIAPRTGVIQLRNTATGVLVTTIYAEGYRGYSAFSDDGRLLAIESQGKFVRLWDTGTDTLRTTPAGEDDRTPAYHVLGLSPDGRTLATVDGSDDMVRLWDTGTGRHLALIEHGYDSYALGTAAFSPDGRTFALATDGNGVQLWDVPNR